MTTQAVVLFILFELCHWFADFTFLSRVWMLKAKSIGSPILPILAHGSVHGILMFLVAVCFTNSIILAGQILLIQTILHTSIDILKGKVNIWYPEAKDPNKRPYWAILGFDQFLHHLVIIWQTYLIINNI